MIDVEVKNQITEEKIIVIGVGGAGGNAVNRMIECGVTDVEFVAINTDKQALERSLASKTLVIGEKSTRGLGAGGNPEIGKIAAEESKDEIAKIIEGAHMVFVTAGMGGGTGTGAAPVVAGIAKKQDVLTISIVTKPFGFEGRKRALNASTGIENLRENIDTLIVIPNERVLDIIEDDATQADAFHKVDEILRQGVSGLVSIIRTPADINVDFADICSIMKDKGSAHLGVGEASGKNKVKEAMDLAINSPLLETSINGAKSMLVNFSHSPDMPLKDVNRAMTTIKEMLDLDANIIYGMYNSNEKDKTTITIIATDLKEENSKINIAPKIKKEEKDEVITKTYNEYEEKSVEARAPKKSIDVDAEKLNIPSFLRKR